MNWFQYFEWWFMAKLGRNDMLLGAMTVCIMIVCMCCIAAYIAKCCDKKVPYDVLKTITDSDVDVITDNECVELNPFNN